MTEFTKVETQKVAWFFNRELIPAISKRLREEDGDWYVTVHLSEYKSIANAFKTEAEADQFIESIINPDADPESLKQLRIKACKWDLLDANYVDLTHGMMCKHAKRIVESLYIGNEPTSVQ